MLNKNKVVYIAHPISGDVKGNIDKILRIIREINITEPYIIPIAPYVVDCLALDDDILWEREKGIKNNKELLKLKFVDQLWLFGDRISVGMEAEIILFYELGLLKCIIPKSDSISNKDIHKVILDYYL